MIIFCQFVVISIFILLGNEKEFYKDIKKFERVNLIKFIFDLLLNYFK